MGRTHQGLRLLGPPDLPDVHRVLDADPVTHVFVDSRVRLTGLDPRWLGGEMWGYDEGGSLVSLCHAAANLAPVAGHDGALRAFAGQALSKARVCGSIVGRNDEVMALWGLLAPQWGPARSVRPHQPFLTITEKPQIEPSPAVRAARPDELDILYPACVAMYTEELGVSPELGGGATAYRARIAQLISRHHAFVHIEGGEVIFKAELGAVTPYAAQLQSVWVNPRWRGQGLAAAGVAAVCSVALRFIAPVVCLYVNEHNQPARRTYDRVGFTETAKFATILL